MNLEFLYLDGCACWHQFLENLRQALRSEGMSLKISLIRVVGAQHARALRFQGCPTIRLRGRNLFPGVSCKGRLYCRLFYTPNGPKGWPTVEMILRRLRGLRWLETLDPRAAQAGQTELAHGEL